VQRFAD